MAAMIKFATKDEEVFEIPIDLAKMSKTIFNMITGLGVDDEDEEVIRGMEPILLENVNGPTFKRVIEWCEHHKTIDSGDMWKIKVSEWNENFMKPLTLDELLDLIEAANYLEMKPMLDQSTKGLAARIKGKTVARLREMFNIINDHTSVEEEKIRKENAWKED